MANHEHQAFKIVMLIRELYGSVNHCLVDNMATHRFTHQQLLVIKLVAHHGKTTVSELCKEMSLSKGTVSGIISRLERDKIIEKLDNPVDKRSSLIVFSEEGKQIAKRMRSTMNDSFASLFTNATDEELNEGILALQKLLTLTKTEESKCPQCN